MNALEVSQLSFAYGPRQALDQVSLSLAPGPVSYTHLTLPTNREV